jgi:hypothetical protein
MDVLVITSPSHPLNEVPPGEWLDDEDRALWQLYRTGVLKQVWARHDITGMALLLEVPCLDAAEEHVMSLPLVRQRRFTAELIQLGPFVGLERLFLERFRSGTPE